MFRQQRESGGVQILKVKDIERLLAGNGIGKSKLDMVTRQLRKAGKLPNSARGVNALEATRRDAARILIAVAGANKGVTADRRLSVLAPMKSDSTRSPSLERRLQELLRGGLELSQVLELRIARNARVATLQFTDGTCEHFLPSKPGDYSKRIKVEGVIPGKLLIDLASRLKDSSYLIIIESAPKEDDD